jgi:hypothetical protein
MSFPTRRILIMDRTTLTTTADGTGRAFLWALDLAGTDIIAADTMEVMDPMGAMAQAADITADKASQESSFKF